jgi:CRP-like cAMP-binding protein
MLKAKTTHEQFLLKLGEYKNSLQYLTQNDWALIIDRSSPLSFKKNDNLIQQGKPTEVVYVIASGTVKVSVSEVQVAQLGPGEICGEMAFLEHTLPSATAVATEEVEAYALSWSTLIDLFELFPHLASRFYRSVALNLSRRLRDLVARQK